MQTTAIRFNCLSCRARIRAPADAAGRKCRCPGCGSLMTVPDPDGRPEAPRPAGDRPREKTACSFCTYAIEDGEPRTECESCKLPFHSECWEFNLGCSAYGCKGQSALKKGPDIRIEPRPPAPPPGAGEEPQWVLPVAPAAGGDAFPLEYLYLLASVAFFFLGLLVCGCPSLVWMPTGLFCLLRRERPRSYAALVAGAVICLAGLVAGVFASVAFWDSK